MRSSITSAVESARAIAIVLGVGLGALGVGTVLAGGAGSPPSPDPGVPALSYAPAPPRWDGYETCPTPSSAAVDDTGSACRAATPTAEAGR